MKSCLRPGASSSGSGSTSWLRLPDSSPQNGRRSLSDLILISDDLRDHQCLLRRDPPRLWVRGWSALAISFRVLLSTLRICSLRPAPLVKSRGLNVVSAVPRTYHGAGYPLRCSATFSPCCPTGHPGRDKPSWHVTSDTDMQNSRVRTPSGIWLGCHAMPPTSCLVGARIHAFVSVTCQPVSLHVTLP